MGFIFFSPFGYKSVIVKFLCNNCQNEVDSEEIYIPHPNLQADRNSDSYNENDGYAVCDNCNKEYDIYVHAGFSDGYVEVFGVDDENIYIESLADEDDIELDNYINEHYNAIVNSQFYIYQFENEINNLKKLNDIDLKNSELQEILYRQIYSGAITCLEDYLSTTLIQNITEDDAVFKRFVVNYKPFQDMKFTLNELYDKVDTIHKTVKEELVKIVYHNLHIVRPIYETTLGIKFPDIGDMMKAISTRHDMVHRNGKDKKGIKITLTKEDVSKVIDKVYNFANIVENELEMSQKEF